MLLIIYVHTIQISVMSCIYMLHGKVNMFRSAFRYFTDDILLFFVVHSRYAAMSITIELECHSDSIQEDRCGSIGEIQLGCVDYIGIEFRLYPTSIYITKACIVRY